MNSMRGIIFVTPSSRGLGRAVTRHYIKNTSLPIVATYRKEPEEVRSFLFEGLGDVSKDRVTLVKMDVEDESSVIEAAQFVKTKFYDEGNPIRVAFVCPGILRPDRKYSAINLDEALESFKVNSLGPISIAKNFSSLLPPKNSILQDERGVPSFAVWANVSARVGSIGDNRLGGWVSYRSSKAALNQATKCLDLELKRNKINGGAIVLHPGTVKTEFSKDFWSGVKEGKLFEPSFSAERLCQIIENIKEEDFGKFWDWDKKEVEW